MLNEFNDNINNISLRVFLFIFSLHAAYAEKISQAFEVHNFFLQIKIHLIFFTVCIYSIHRTIQQRLSGSALFFRELFHENKQNDFFVCKF